MKKKKSSPKQDVLFYALVVVAVFMLLGAFYPAFTDTVKSQYLIGFFSLFFFTASVLHSWKANGKKFTIIFFTIMVLYSFSAEYAGTHSGIFYSKSADKPILLEGETYYYASFLPVHIFKVPLPLMLMWPFIIYCAFYMAQLVSQKIFARMKNLVLPASIILASFIAMLWDLSFDPLATKLGFWTWIGGGSAFEWINGGIPVGNFTSWFLITFIALSIFALIMRSRGEDVIIRKSEGDKSGVVLSLFLFLFIWTFSIPQKEFLFLIIAVVTQLLPWGLANFELNSRKL